MHEALLASHSFTVGFFIELLPKRSGVCETRTTAKKFSQCQNKCRLFGLSKRDAMSVFNDGSYYNIYFTTRNVICVTPCDAINFVLSSSMWAAPV